jgi:2-dehydropantoate 2-reductase
MTPDRKLRIGIVGAGAIGSALAGQLALAGQPVALVARGQRRDDLIRHGLRLRDAGGDVRIARPAIINPDGLAELDLVIVAVKAHALPELLPQLAAAMAPSALLMPAINGLPWWYFLGQGRLAGTSLASLDPERNLSPLFAPERLIGCVVYTRAAIEGGDVIVHGTQALRIGPVTGNTLPAAIAEQFAQAGIGVSLEADIRREVWRKLVRNASTNLVSGLTGTTLAQLGEDSGLIAIVREIAREVNGLAAELGCRAEADLDGFIAEIRRAGPHVPSTLQDMRAGRMPELAALAEAPLEVAGIVNYPMPMLQRVLSLLRARLRYGTA